MKTSDFRLNTDERSRTKQNRATASAFATWVFEQTTNAERRSMPKDRADPHLQLRLDLGVVSHREIELFLKHRWMREQLGSRVDLDWSLIYADNQKEPDRVFHASSVTVDGSPMRCRPDVLLQCAATNSLIVIERKTTYFPEPMIPNDGWPNVEAQLWCYSWIDEFRYFEDVLLVGQLWRREHGALVLCHRHSPWRRGEIKHERRCTHWFGAYGGTVEA